MLHPAPFLTRPPPPPSPLPATHTHTPLTASTAAQLTRVMAASPGSSRVSSASSRALSAEVITPWNSSSSSPMSSPSPSALGSSLPATARASCLTIPWQCSAVPTIRHATRSSSSLARTCQSVAPNAAAPAVPPPAVLGRRASRRAAYARYTRCEAQEQQQQQVGGVRAPHALSCPLPTRPPARTPHLEHGCELQEGATPRHARHAVLHAAFECLHQLVGGAQHRHVGGEGLPRLLPHHPLQSPHQLLLHALHIHAAWRGVGWWWLGHEGGLGEGQAALAGRQAQGPRQAGRLAGAASRRAGRGAAHWR